RHREHVDHRTRRVRDVDAHRAAPDGFEAEKVLLPDMAEQEDNALHGCTSRAYPFGCEDQRLVEKLLGQVPVLSRGPATDIALAKECGDQDPRVLDDLCAPGEVEWDRDVE